MLRGIHSVLIWREDVNRLLPFYRDVLCLHTEMEGDGFVVFQASTGGQLALGAHSEVEGRSRAPPHRVMVDLPGGRLPG